jgi:branched-chain amino acid transport system permease protein
MAYSCHILIMVAIYSVLVLGLRFATCYGGVLVVAPTVFFATGAYATGILAGRLGWPVGATVIVGAITASLLGLAVGLLSLRLKGDYLLLAALGVCEIGRSILNNADELTGGAVGIMNIPSIVAFVPPALRMSAIAIIVTLLLIGCISFSRRVQASPYGRIQMALKEDEVGTAAMGREVNRIKVTSVVWGALWMTLAGSMFATYSSYIDPSTFGVNEAIMIFAMFVLGGMRTILGCILATGFLFVLPELLRLFGMPSSLASPMRQVVSGVALLCLMLIGRKGYVEIGRVGA